RADPGLVAGYEALKRELSEAHPNDRAAYTKGKTRFVTEVVANARGGAIL
ncbi:MAG: GrpB family protein, partial [Flavobacteriales bacterium]|nr:GrpB family protein [Flavobacteriales bacterium]